MKKTLENILQRIQHTVQDTPLILEGKKIGELSFQEIPDSLKETLCAVDGGSATVLQTPNVCIVFARIVAVTMDANFKKNLDKQEGFIVTTFVDEAHVRAIFYDMQGTEEELFTLTLNELKNVEETTVLLHVANSARKQLEWKKVLQKNTLTLWDGIFTAQNSAEESLAKELQTRENILGLAKTTTAVGSWNVFVQAPQNPWSTKVFEQTYFVKLHEKAKHYFRIDATSTQTFPILRAFAKDPIFLGYPYPLLLADQLARVSNTELSGLKIRLQSIFGKENPLLLGESATNAHSILDKAQF